MTAKAERWAIVVPVKRLAEAKSRLALEPAVRQALALAMAVDTVRAAADCPVVDRVVAVSDDAAAAEALRAAGATVVPDVPDAGLNPALVHGASVADLPPGAGVAALAADLPALRSADLDALLRAVPADTVGVVADAAGAGTTLYAATNAARFHPEFGADSRARHAAAGAVDLTEVAGASLRRDVDTVADLRAAGRLGLGSFTAGVVRAHAVLPDERLPDGGR